MKRVLVIEDDPDFCEAVVRTLTPYYQPLKAHTGQEGLKVATAEKPDLVLIDLHLPEMSGFEVCEQLRSRPGTRDIPIIILTGESEPDSRVKGLDAGADDYVSKPFHAQELLARIRARLRRREADAKGQEDIQLGNLRYEARSSQVWVEEEPIYLTQVELQMLRYFLEYPDEMISRERLLGDLWPDSVVTSRTVDTHVAHLRKKLKKFSCNLKTVFRGGYILKTR
jgi:two-component system phosphate regulon response regulator PhoB